MGALSRCAGARTRHRFHGPSATIASAPRPLIDDIARLNCSSEAGVSSNFFQMPPCFIGYSGFARSHGIGPLGSLM